MPRKMLALSKQGGYLTSRFIKARWSGAPCTDTPPAMQRERRARSAADPTARCGEARSTLPRSAEHPAAKRGAPCREARSTVQRSRRARCCEVAEHAAAKLPSTLQRSCRARCSEVAEHGAKPPSTVQRSRPARCSEAAEPAAAKSPSSGRLLGRI